MANDGTSWRNAYTYLQDTLADANSTEKPVEILVAQGVYKPDQGATMNSRDSSATFKLINGVAIYGGYAGVGRSDPDLHDVELFETILSGDLDGNDADVRDPEDLLYSPERMDNSYQVVTGSGTDETAVINGFTITGGYANIYTNRNGAGLVIEYGSPQISNCTFIHDSAYYFGGGIYNYYSNPTLVNCSFIQNSADDKGGGIYNYRSSPVLRNCKFSDNYANNGGGIHSRLGKLGLTDCTFRYNSARYGGGICSNDSSIASSYSTGTVTGNENAGGLMGMNYRSVTSSFWDIETSGRTNMCGLDSIGCDDSYGKTTVEMQTAGTFVDAGWDFVDETNNGTDDIWWILEGQDYPRLWWELISGN